MPGATSRPPTTVMGQIMATFALPKDKDKDQDHQIPDKTSNTIRMLGTIAVMWLTGMSSPTSTPSAKEDLMSTMDNLLQVTLFVAIVTIFQTNDQIFHYKNYNH